MAYNRLKLGKKGRHRNYGAHYSFIVITKAQSQCVGTARPTAAGTTRIKLQSVVNIFAHLPQKILSSRVLAGRSEHVAFNTRSPTSRLQNYREEGCKGVHVGASAHSPLYSFISLEVAQRLMKTTSSSIPAHTIHSSTEHEKVSPNMRVSLVDSEDSPMTGSMISKLQAQSSVPISSTN